MTENMFKTSMAFMMKIFGAKIDDQVYTTYWQILKKFSDEEYLKIQENIISSFIPSAQTPFPLPAHFLKAAGKSGESKARLAVMAVIRASTIMSIYDSITFGDRALHATIERFGGWPEVASWSLADWGFKEKSFMSTYEAALIDGTGPDKCIGIVEHENAGKVINDEQKKIIDKYNGLKMFKWNGFDNLQIENKKENIQELIDISNLTKNIGKEVI